MTTRWGIGERLGGDDFNIERAEDFMDFTKKRSFETHETCVAGKYYQVCLFQIIWWLRRGKPGKCKLQMSSMSSQHWGILNSFFQTMTPIKPMFLSFWKAVFVVTPVSVDNHLGKMRKRFGRQTEHRRQSSSTVMQQAKNSWNPQVPKSKEQIRKSGGEYAAPSILGTEP